MTAIEALTLFDNLASGVSLNRKDHKLVEEATQVLLGVINELDGLKNKKESNLEIASEPES